MRSNALLKHKFLMLCGAKLSPSHNARAFALGSGDSCDLGFLWPGVQNKSDNQNRLIYVKYLIGMAPGAIDVASGEVYFRSNHAFKFLPAAAGPTSGAGRTIILRTAGLGVYLFATYSRYGTKVCYVDNLNGIITIPFLAFGYHLTGWTLFAAATKAVPDGGITVTLLVWLSVYWVSRDASLCVSGHTKSLNAQDHMPTCSVVIKAIREDRSVAILLI